VGALEEGDDVASIMRHVLHEARGGPHLTRASPPWLPSDAARWLALRGYYFGALTANVAGLRSLLTALEGFLPMEYLHAPLCSQRSGCNRCATMGARHGDAVHRLYVL